MQNLSLKLRLVFLIVAMTLVSAGALTYRSLDLTRAQLEKDQILFLNNTVTQMSHNLESDLANRAREVLFIANSPKLRADLRQLGEIQKIIAYIKSAYPYYAWIGMTDADGLILMDSDQLLAGADVAQRSWFLEGKQGLAFGDAHDAILLAKLLPDLNQDDTPLRLLDVSAPVVNSEGVVTGVIGAHLSLKWAYDIREEMLSDIADSEVEILVFNKESKLVLDSADHFPDMQGFDTFLAQITNRSLPSEQGAVVTWPDGREYLTSVSLTEGSVSVPSLGWTVLARKPAEVAFAPANDLVKEILFISILVLFAFIVLLWLALDRILKPLQKIAVTADRISQNNLDTPIPELAGDNEIARFARSLVGLVNSLREKNSELLLAERIFNENRLGIMVTDASRTITRVNQAFTDLTGFSQEEAVGQKPSFLSSGRHDAEFYDDMNASLMFDGSWSGEIWNRNRSGRIYPEWLRITALYNDEGKVTHYIGMFEDITEKKGVERKIELLTNYDELTGLPNRTRVMTEVNAAIEEYRFTQRPFAVLMINIVKFKQINDTLGHQAGDSLIKRVAQRLNAYVHHPSIMARWSGDEFLIFADGFDGDNAGELARKLTDAMRIPFVVNKRDHHLRISCGISLFPEDAEEAQSLLRFADVAMAEAGRDKAHAFSFYTASMNEVVIEQMELEACLRRAQETDFRDFELYYQPQYSSVDGEMKGIEALIRWQHPVRGFVPPDLFIPLAESTGLIDPLGHWVVRTACKALARVQAETDSNLSMSINISGVQLQNPEFVAQLCAEADTLSIAHDRLVVEVTETAFTGDEARANETLSQVRDLGFGVSIDDFGTGYATLDYIQRFKPTEIKVDRVFIDKMLTDEHCLNIVKFTLGLADTMHLDVVAEGVETQEQLDHLKTLGKPLIQGYLLAKPMPLDALLDDLKSRS